MWIDYIALLSVVALTIFIADSPIRAAPSMDMLARKGQRWPPHAEEFQRKVMEQSGHTKPHRQPADPHSDVISMALDVMQKNSRPPSPVEFTNRMAADSPDMKEHHRRRSDHKKPEAQRRSAPEPDNAQSKTRQRTSNIYLDDRQLPPAPKPGSDYDYDFWPPGGQKTEEDENDSVLAALPCQKGNPHVDAQNCSEPIRPANYQFPSGVIMIEAHINETVREFLKICSDIETVEVDSPDDMQTLIGTIHRHVSKFDQGPANSAIFLFNLENYHQWTKERVIDVVRTSVDVMRANFDDLMIYSKFHRDGTESTETVLLQLRYDIKFWLADLCVKGLARCADLASVVLGSVVELGADTEDQLTANFGKSVDQSTVMTQKYCRQLGLGPGTRIIDVKPVSIDTNLPSRHSESSLMLSDLLPKDQMTYDKNRPPKYHGRPTVVYYHVTVLSIDTINEESMTYVADIFLGQSWRDHRLRLPENMTTDYRILDVSWLQNIWRPDCFFKNAKRVTFHEMSVPNHYLWLYHDKTLLYMAKLTLVLSCAMKFETYPHDTQICSLMIESLSHTTHDLVFKWNITDPLVVNPDIELPQLDIAKNMTEDCTLEYSTGNFTCLAVVFNLQRRLGYHLFHTYIPSALIVVMSWISFWIKPEAIPARVTLGVTSLLTLATQSTQSQRSLPPVSYVKGIDIWMSSCTVFVFMSLMEFAVVNHFMGPVATKLMKGYSDDDIVSPTSSKGTNGRGGSFRARGRSPDRSQLALTPQYVTFCHGREVALFIDKWSRGFFPFSFIILNIVYWTTFLPANEEFSIN